MSFDYRGSLDGTKPMLQTHSIITTVTVAVGDAVSIYANGRLTNASAAVPILGIVHSITKGDLGIPAKSSDVTAGTANRGVDTSVTTTASDVYYATVDVNKSSIYSASVSGTLGTTNSSNLPGCRIDVNSAGTTYSEVLETTATRTLTTVANFFSHGVDPTDSTRLLVSIAASDMHSPSESTA